MTPNGEETTQPSEPQPSAPPPSGGGAGAGGADLWGSPWGKAIVDVVTNPVQALKVMTFAAAILGLTKLIADMRSLEGAPDPSVWATFTWDLLITVVFVGVLHGLRALIERR